jgi:outer membrane protein OmpA-like peptidoglycan-associated protein
MRKLLYLPFILLIITLQLKAQEFLPFASSNYAGITGVHLQPASIADSRYSFDMAIASSSASVSNNFYAIDPYVFWHPSVWQDFDFQGPYVSRNTDGTEKMGIASIKQDLFSFMISLSDKDAIAFTPSVRTITNVNNMTEDLAILIDKLNQEPDLWGLKLKDENVNAQMNSWVEYGFTYARVILDKQKHFLKAGATLKITQGMGSAYMFMKDLNYEVTNQDTISLYNTYTNYGTSDNLNEDFSYQFNANPSLSFDFGVVYEYRPEWMKYTYDMDGETNLWRRDKDKYLLRLGFTVSDLGGVRYHRNPQSIDFNADVRNMNINDLGISSIDDFNNFIDSTFTTYDISDKYTMNLPVCLSLQADVRVAEGLYVNFTPYLALNNGNNNVDKVHYLSAFNLVPRYDLKWFGVSLPVQYNAYKQWAVGLGLRLGPIWVGWNDFFTMMVSSKNRYGTSASIVMKLPVFYSHPKDRDGDKVSDKKDLCPDVPGLFELDGCPDADLDGITDAKDKCPTVYGLAQFEGCPDTDLDGVIDEIDLCPDVKGLPLFGGCPDSDGDSIIDQNDACPYNAGLISMNGCPDQDNDGIADKDDNCPTVAGTRENRGCPFIDSDGDGIIDEADYCPGIKGPVDNHGCPYQDTDNDSIPDKDDDCPSIAGKAVFKGCPDTDGDGISDKYDMCPTIPGIAENSGCPEIKKEEQEILKKAFDNLEFETGKSVIRKSSLGALDELANVMKKRPEFKLSLAGYTDNVGNPGSNLTLSKNRTMAVKNYLVKKGVESNRIKTEWFGQDKPIATNTTPEGRQQNRRVEMKIVFE